MNVKRAIIERLPRVAKPLLAVPHDWYQTRNANRAFTRSDIPCESPIRTVRSTPSASSMRFQRMTWLDAVDLTGPSMPAISLFDPNPPNRQLLFEGSLGGYEKKAVFDGEYKLLASRGDEVEIILSIPGDEEIDVPVDRLESMRTALPPWPDGTGGATDVSDVVEDRLAQFGHK